MAKKKRFLRRTADRLLKLGKRKKSLRKWRRPRGRHNKMREARGGLKKVKIGYKGKNKKIEIEVVKNIKDLEKIKGNIIIGKIGRKKKIEIAKKAKEKGFNILNLNVKKFLKQIEKKEEAHKKEKKK